MELRHLKYFVTVAEELNFSKAAQKLFTSQPSLSQQIKDLESELNLKLFNRTKRKVELTEEGKQLIPYAEATLAQAENTIALTRKMAGENNSNLRIGFIPVVEIKIFPKVLPALHVQHPDLKLQLKSMTDIEQIKALNSNQLDIGFIREKLTNEDLDSQLVLREKMIAIFPQNHPLTKFDKIPLKELNGINLIIPTEERSPNLHKIVINFLNRKDINFNIIQTAENLFFNINSVGMGLGCAILPNYIEPIVKNNKNIVIKELDTELPLIDLFIIYNTKKNQASITKFVKLVKELI